MNGISHLFASQHNLLVIVYQNIFPVSCIYWNRKRFVTDKTLQFSFGEVSELLVAGNFHKSSRLQQVCKFFSFVQNETKAQQDNLNVLLF